MIFSDRVSHVIEKPISCKDRLSRIEDWLENDNPVTSLPPSYTYEGIKASVKYDNERINKLKKQLYDIDSGIFSSHEVEILLSKDWREMIVLHNRLLSMKESLNLSEMYFHGNKEEHIKKLKKKINEISSQIKSHKHYLLYLKYHNLVNCKEKEILDEIGDIERNIKTLINLDIHPRKVTCNKRIYGR